MERYGLIGYPLDHSFSPRYFFEKFKQEGIDNCTYNTFPLPSIEEFLRLLQDYPDLRGLNVTVPYKEAVLPYLTELDDVARTIGAVNTIKIDGGHFKGFNTDVTGFDQSISPRLLPQHRQALILGTGGSSKAICYCLEQKGLNIAFVSRSKEKGAYTYDDLTEEVINAHQLIINTTPVGMYPVVDKCPPIPYEYVSSLHLLVDLVYNPPETVFTRMGQQFGAMAMNGYEMLQLQAEASWRIWQES